MQDAFIHKTERPWPNRRLKIAAIVGHTTATTSRIWVRTGAPGTFCLLYFRAEQASEKWFDEAKAQTPFPIDQLPAGIRKSDEFDSVWDNDATAVVELSDLAAGASWRYALCRIAPENSQSREARLVLGHDREYSFRTPSPTRDFRFALFSCHMPFKAGGLFSDKTEIANMDIWDIMSRALRHRRDNGNDLDFVIAGGDQCYVDGIPTLDIWRYLNKVMRKEGGQILPSEETMTQWYRDIYRGYWGFDSVRRTFASLPTYMIWDDHELGDGWGSHKLPAELDEVLPDFVEKGISPDEGRELIARMGAAAKRVYCEYQHCHNPPTPSGQFDYHFRHKDCGFYVLDGRGHRDIARPTFRVLGEEQMRRFEGAVGDFVDSGIKCLFVVSAVPVLHTKAAIVGMAESVVVGKAGLTDDLRDAWEHQLHDEERRELLRILFAAAAKGVRVAVLSGDVHVSAAFKISDGKNSIFQLTSSAVTYNLSTMQSWVLRMGASDDGTTDDGYHFERLALRTEPSYSVIRVVADADPVKATFQIYGRETVRQPSRQRRPQTAPNAPNARKDFWAQEPEERPLMHSLAKIPLTD